MIPAEISDIHIGYTILYKVEMGVTRGVGLITGVLIGDYTFLLTDPRNTLYFNM